MLEIITKYMDESTALMKTLQENISLLNKITKTHTEALETMNSTIKSLNDRLTWVVENNKEKK